MIFTQQLGGIGRIFQPAAPAPSGVTWDPADKGSATLSNGNLTALRTGAAAGFANVRSTVSKTTGKWYFEVQIDIEAGFMPGVGITSQSVSGDGEFGGGTQGYELRVNGTRYVNTTATGGWSAAFVANDVMMVAFDMGAGHIWWGKNGTWLNSGNPAAGTSPAATGITGTHRAAAVCGTSSAVGKVTARFASADFTYSPPAGFSAL